MLEVNPWDKAFSEKGILFKDPQEDLPSIVSKLKKIGAKRVLDHGCGDGRHVLYLVKHGFEVWGFDRSPHAIDLARKRIKSEGLDAKLEVREMFDPLPYATGFFDGVISIQVLHHGKLSQVREGASEILRVLRKGGLFFITVPSKKNQGKRFKKLEPGTYVPLDGLEAGLPHHYFTKARFAELFSISTVEDIHLDSTNHWCLLGFKE